MKDERRKTKDGGMVEKDGEMDVFGVVDSVQSVNLLCKL